MDGSRICRGGVFACGPWYPITWGYGALHPLSGLLLVGSVAAAAAAARVFVDVNVVGMVCDE